MLPAALVLLLVPLVATARGASTATPGALAGFANLPK